MGARSPHRVLLLHQRILQATAWYAKSRQCQLPCAKHASGAKVHSFGVTHFDEWQLLLFFCRVPTGFKVDETQAVHVDEEGEEHTLCIAKGSRMLGGNSGYFKGDANDIILALDNVRFSKAWLSVNATAVEEALDISKPPEAELKRAINDDYQALCPPVHPLHHPNKVFARFPSEILGGVGGNEPQAGRQGYT
eukprot:6173127-Pleurochrysis_carterae.AAC.1